MDADGRMLTPILDVLALLRIDADADLLLVCHRSGARRALRVSALVDGDGIFLRCIRRTPRRWRGRTVDGMCVVVAVGSAWPVESLRATLFASFVGLS